MTVPTILGIHLLEVDDAIVSFGDFCFVAARFDFEDDVEGKQEFPLYDRLRTRSWLEKVLNQCDVTGEPLLNYWTRSRISAVFGYSPPTGTDIYRESFLLEFCFLAIQRSKEGNSFQLNPFVVTDRCNGPALIFRKNDEGLELLDKIACSFWSLLLRKPSLLVPFEDFSFDSCDGYWSKFGYEQGRFFQCELTEPEAGIVQFDQHLRWSPGEVGTCPDCDGTGEESFFPAGAECETCNGEGFCRRVNLPCPAPVE